MEDGCRAVAQITHAFDLGLGIIEPDPKIIVRAGQVVGVIYRQPTVRTQAVGDRFHGTVKDGREHQLIILDLVGEGRKSRVGKRNWSGRIGAALSAVGGGGNQEPGTPDERKRLACAVNGGQQTGFSVE